MGERVKLACSGVSRMGDNEKAVLVSFSRPLTDDELRTLHDDMRAVLRLWQRGL